MTKPTAYVPAPALELREGTPVSTAFDDVYFSRSGGVAETEHVFLKGNGLPARWIANINGDDDSRVAFHGEPAGPGSVSNDGDDDRCVAEGEPRSGGSARAKGSRQNQFTIAELGFGTGLNFLVTMKAFRAAAHPDMRLHYIAIEKYPFTPEQLRTLLAEQPELVAQAEELIAAYPVRLPGIHRVHLGQVSLILCFGDVAEMLAELNLSRGPFAPYATLTPAARGSAEPTHRQNNRRDNGINAWFLDGFSPAKNSDMWGEAIYQQIASLSAPGATFATFTAASHVRRGLEAMGFTVTKNQGFGRKREMSVGIYEGASLAPSPQERLTPAARGSREALRTAQTSILVVGGGIAGATLARALAERGYAVTLLERGTIASGASGNAAGVLFPQITKQWGGASDWYFTAYGYALRQLNHWQKKGAVFDHARCGMLRLPRHVEEETLLQHLQQTHGLDESMVHWLNRDAASEQAGVPLQTGAAFFPEGIWLNPAQLCAALLQHEHITVHEQSAVETLTRTGDAWQVTCADGTLLKAEYCCITAAHETVTLLSDYGIKLGAVGGQVSLFSAGAAASTLRSILCHRGYVIPAAEHILVGATYHRDAMVEVHAARHEENKAALDEILPGWMRGNASAGRSSIRATTPDRLPYIGAMDDGLYVATGYGSRGLLSAPLAAEMIASMIAGEALPVSKALQHLTRPLRFKA